MLLLYLKYDRDNIASDSYRYSTLIIVIVLVIYFMVVLTDALLQQLMI